MKKRVTILDTNVLINDPKSPIHFANENVVIPIQVVEEVVRFKLDPREKNLSIFQYGDISNETLNLIKQNTKKNKVLTNTIIH